MRDNYKSPPSIGFSRQEYWHGLPFPSPTKLQIGANESLNQKHLHLNQKGKDQGQIWRTRGKSDQDNGTLGLEDWDGKGSVSGEII